MEHNEKPAYSGALFTPLLVGLGYGIVHELAAGRPLEGLYAQSPLVISIFSGILLTMPCRPVLMRVSWRRGSAIGVSLSLLLLCGVGADWLFSWLAHQAGVAPFPRSLPLDPLPELAGALAAAAMMALLFRPRGGEIGLAQLKERLGFRPPGEWLRRLALLAAAAVALTLVLGALDALYSRAGDGSLPLLLEPNPWLLLTGQGVVTGGGALHEGPAGPLGGGLLLALYWARYLLLFLPLLPIVATVRGSGPQMTLVFFMLIFILSDFVPMMHDQPYFSVVWLLNRVGMGLVRAALLAAMAERLLARRREQ